jgi:hypothetical protein
VAISEAATRRAELRIQQGVNEIDRVLSEGSESLVDGIVDSVKQLLTNLETQVSRRLEAERREFSRGQSKTATERKVGAS